jgi:hypothetical protein
MTTALDKRTAGRMKSAVDFMTSLVFSKVVVMVAFDMKYMMSPDMTEPITTRAQNLTMKIA